jgi:hypothetical protein
MRGESRGRKVKTDFTTKARRTRSLKAQISETFVAFVIFVAKTAFAFADVVTIYLTR